MKVYIVCENSTINYIPEPFGRYDIPNPFDIGFVPLTPRVDPIFPQTISEPTIQQPLDIVCVCKDYDTAKHYVNIYKNRYIIGPYNVL